jgi:hypothetical protein
MEGGAFLRLNRGAQATCTTQPSFHYGGQARWSLPPFTLRRTAYFSLASSSLRFWYSSEV